MLSNAQILHGKLEGRGYYSPTKDLYDIAVTRRKDRKALEIAVNCMPRATIDEITARWEGLTRYHQDRATKDLKSVPDAYRDIMNDPAAHAVEAARDCRYQQMTLSWSHGKLQVYTLNDDGEQQTRQLPSGGRGQIQVAIERAGIADYVRRNTPTRIDTIIAVVEAGRRRTGSDETLTVWESGWRTRGSGNEPTSGRNAKVGAAPERPTPASQAKSANQKARVRNGPNTEGENYSH